MHAGRVQDVQILPRRPLSRRAAIKGSGAGCAAIQRVLYTILSGAEEASQGGGHRQCNWPLCPRAYQRRRSDVAGEMRLAFHGGAGGITVGPEFSYLPRSATWHQESQGQ